MKSIPATFQKLRGYGRAFLFLALVSFPLPCWAEELKIVAVVNDEVITEAELNRALAPVVMMMQADLEPEELAQQVPQVRDRILQQLIEEKLLLQEALNPRPVEVAKGRVGTPPPIVVSDFEVDQMLLDTQQRFESPEAFEEALKAQGLTLEDLRARFRDQITIEKLISREIRSRITVSPAEVTTYYDSHPKEFETPQAVQVAVILIKPKDFLDLSQAKKRAEDLRQQILSGADFYELARRYSDGPNAQMGGRIGYLEKGKGLKEIEEILFSLKAGEISPVIQTPTGFDLFRVESIRPAGKRTLEEVQAKIQEKIFQEKSAARFREWIEKLKEDAYISVQ